MVTALFPERIELASVQLLSIIGMHTEKEHGMNKFSKTASGGTLGGRACRGVLKCAGLGSGEEAEGEKRRDEEAESLKE